MDLQKTHISGAAVFVVSDIQQSVRFYRDQLGFLVQQIWGEPPSFAIADAPRASIMLKAGDCDDQPDIVPNARRVPGLWDAYIWIGDAKGLHADLSDRGAAPSAMEATPYGCTEFTVTDPDGYVICFGECP